MIDGDWEPLESIRLEPLAWIQWKEVAMQIAGRISQRFGAGFLVLLFLAGTCLAQNKRETFDATAYGTTTQMGRNVGIKIIIESYSTPDDQRILLEAFSKGGNEGLVKALEKMPARGRIAVVGGLGYDVTYIRQFPTPTGRKVRLITYRKIAFGEAWASTRSEDYSVTAVELDLNKDKNKSTGTLLPAAKLQVNKQNEIEIETFQFPWRLANIIDWDK